MPIPRLMMKEAAAMSDHFEKAKSDILARTIPVIAHVECGT